MHTVSKTIAGWVSVTIFAGIVLFYIEGFAFYSFQGNLGFLLSFFIGPIGILGGYIGREQNKAIQSLGLFGNAAALAFSVLYWPVGYIIEWLAWKVF